ncbi:hypothetical protein I309_04451 [Cryptococcus deuterogattii LA55]|nr:hypothetical protein I309_04451 [Cryptococcus deuterogattii LA55]KIR93747.1 hypothetical protein I304_02423 [Cryptococcus deuterogattii CBS 10090]
MPSDPDPSPALTHASLTSSHSLQSENSQVHLASHLSYDRSLTTALSHLVDHLIEPLATLYTPEILNSLLKQLKQALFVKFQPTWDEGHPQVGSGTRSLICTKHYGLPFSMRCAAVTVGVEEKAWRKAIAKSGGRENRSDKGEEWEVWCDPGQVVWRWGAWEWEDPGFEPVKTVREPLQVIWQAATEAEKLSPATPVKSAQPSNPTPNRPSYAIPIRAPTVLAIPPTPSESENRQNESKPLERGSLLPAFSSLGLGQAPGQAQRNQQASGWSSSDASSRSTSLTYSEHDEPGSPGHERPASRVSHRGSESQSSVSSSVSDSNSGHTQLLTPDTRPTTADPFNVPMLPMDTVKHGKEKEEKPKATPTNTARGRTTSPSALGESTVQSTTPTAENNITPRVPTPTVTPYDGGNVTVLGGGVKLGGGGSHSRTSSAHSSQRIPIDRSRSPSISLASRALNTAVGPSGEGRKQRTRRRIMPTYLGHLGQPGVGGPAMGVFYGGSVSPGGMGFGPGYQHVGVGVSPPPVGIRGPMPRMG